MLLALSAFISKAAVNISSGLIFFVAFLDIAVNGTYKQLVKNRFFLAFLLPLLVGMVLSLFSDAGISGLIFFLSRYRFFFIFIPFMTFIKEKKHLYLLFFMLNISGCLAVVYGFVNFYLKSSEFGFDGLLIIGRNSDLLASLSLMNTILLFDFDVKNNFLKFFVRLGLMVSLGLCIPAICIIGQRGAMLGLYVGWIVYSLFFNRKFLVVLIIVSLAGVMFVNSKNPVMIRIKSIMNLKDDASNLCRMHLLSSGIPYVVKHHLITGTGDKNPEKDFTEFFKSQDKAFQDRYVHAMELPGNFHNSFLQMAVEGGALFLAVYLAGIGYVLFYIVWGLRESGNKVFCMGSLVVSVAAFVTYFFHGELYRYGGMVFYMVLISGCVRETTPGETLGVQMDDSNVGQTLYGSHGPITPAG